MKNFFIVIFLSGLTIFTSCELQKFDRPVNDEDSADNEISDETDFEEISDEGVAELEGVVCTGQTKCYDNGDEIKCPSHGSDFYGTDAHYAISGDCLKRDFSITGTDPDEIVTDNNTRLEWLRNHSKDVYSRSEAVSYCKNLDYGGHSDWRLPDQSELWTIVDFGRGVSPAIDTDAFPLTQSDYFWTSSKDSSDSNLGVFVHFLYGTSGKIKNSSFGYARCVRGKYLPENDFKEESVKEDKILSDSSTGLVWSRSYAAGRRWKDALAYCENLNYGGVRNWKLPNINELKTLFNNEDSSLISVVQEIPKENFWSSTTASLYSVSYAVSINMGNGDIQFESKQDAKYLICVRGKTENETEHCTSDNGCPEGYDCISGVCYESVDECISDDDCEDGFECFEDKCIPEKSFISKWNTAVSGVSSKNQITLPLVENGTYDFTVFWGDGARNKITKWNDPATTHTYPGSGTYTIVITGTFEGWQFCKVTDAGCEASDSTKIVDISRWGGLALGDTEYQFSQSWNLDITAKDVPDLSKTKSFRGAFAGCNTLAGGDSFNSWDVSGIKDMSYMFYRSYYFNQNISSWDVSSVTDMRAMFSEAGSFNQNISTWNVSNVTNMSEMFWRAGSFNQDLSTWNVSNVTKMGGMFLQASSFNSDLSNWNVSKVTAMSGMFYDASLFNRDLSSWNVSNVTHMYAMFEGASSFKSDLSGWNVSSVTNMSHMFNNSSSFNSDISSWDVSNVTDMSYMFEKAALFDSDLSGWDVSNVTNMNSMFRGAKLFNGNLSTWDVSSVTDMDFMFANNDSFNGDISNWNVSSVTTMGSMFYGDTSFDRDLSGWDVSNVTNMSFMFYSVTLSTANYDAILNGWSGLTLQNDVNFHGGNSKYSSAAEAARSKIISDFNWTITDGGKE